LPESSLWSWHHDTRSSCKATSQTTHNRREKDFFSKTGWMNVFKSSGSDAILCHVQMSPGHSIICTNSSFPLSV
jgi:hypothetical protein